MNPRGGNGSEDWTEHAAELRALLRTAGETIPDSLRPSVLGEDNEEPTLLVGSAEGVTTFPGFADDPPADERMKAKLAALREEVEPGGSKAKNRRGRRRRLRLS